MKHLLLFSLACCLFIAACAPSHTSVTVQYNSGEPAYANVGYETFYRELSPYGRWIDYPGYGYVWIPNAEAGFRPYASGGHWVYTDYGWTWVSTYSWGWAPFHYGRWLYEEGYGWIWVPGQEWAPAWVTWGHSGGYYGWAPLAPNVHAGVSASWTPPAHYWNFVPAQHITQVNVNNYVTNTTTNVTVVNNITKNVTIINNNVTNNNITNNNINNKSVTVYNMGPARNDVEKAVNHPIQPLKLSESKQPGAASMSNNQLVVYKPRVQQQTGTGPKPAPEKVETYHASKPSPVNPGGPMIRENANNSNNNNNTKPATVNAGSPVIRENGNNTPGAGMNNNQAEKPNPEINKNTMTGEKKPAPSLVMPATPRNDEQNQAKNMHGEKPDFKPKQPNNGYNQKMAVKDDKAANNKPLQDPKKNVKPQGNTGPKGGGDKPNEKRKKKKDA